MDAALLFRLRGFPSSHTRRRSSVSKFELLGEGEGIHWPDIDEDLSVEGLLRGTRAPS
jgi:hypothetical protein